MANFITMPQKGLSEESAILSSWKVKMGDKVSVGDILFSIETGKATFDVESEFDGFIIGAFGEEGDEIPVKEIVAVIGAQGEKYEKASSAAPSAPVAEVAEVAAAAAPVAAAVAAAERAEGEFIRISPRAKALADKTGIAFAKIPGTGPEGRIVEKDVVAATLSGGFEATSTVAKAAVAVTAAPDVEFEIVKNSAVRKAIAKNMHASLSNMAQLTINAAFDATAVLAYRAKLKASGEKAGLPNITLNDIVVFALSRTLKDHPTLNAHYNDSEMKLFKNTHIGVAVDTPKGLLVPTLFGANKLTLAEVSRGIKDMAGKCQSGNFSSELLSGGTITVSNLGSFGIESFTPVINPPQTALLGVNTLEDRIKVVGGEIKAYKAMNLSLTFDHRALDGADAARFMQALIYNLENFEVLLAL